MISTIMQKTPVIPPFKEGTVFGFSVIFLMLLITIYYLWTKKRIHIRLLPQVEALRESVGRCAEMGRPLVYTYGNPEGMDIFMLAGLNILRYTAKIAAELGVRIVIPLSSKAKALITHTIVKDLIKNVYIAHGTPEEYDEANFRLTGNDDNSWGLTVIKTLYEVEPAAHFFIGPVPSFSAVFGEASRSIPGCVSISSGYWLAMLAQSVIACDYVFLGQDVIAASAYVTEDPGQGGFLRTIDSISVLFILMVVVGAVLATIGVNIIPWISV